MLTRQAPKQLIINGWEGDAPAYELIVDYFGEDVAKTIKRI